MKTLSNKIHIFLLAMIALTTFMQSCDDEDSYAEDRKREKRQIQSFLKKGCTVLDEDSGDTLIFAGAPINVISEDQFYAQDSTTNVDNNEFVLFKSSGLYMQIVRKGTGSILQTGKTVSVICRYTEFNISTDSVQTSNNTLSTEGNPDVMTVTNSSGLLTGTFVSGVMLNAYNSSKVPTGWLDALKFVKLGRQNSEDGEIARVKLIVPSTIGQTDASTSIYPCYYDITFQLGR